MKLAQGDIAWARAEDKRRPVLVVTRSVVLTRLNRVLVAPITKTIRGIPTEILISASAGLRVDSVASFDNLFPIRKRWLEERVGSIPDARNQICKALDAIADC